MRYEHTKQDLKKSVQLSFFNERLSFFANPNPNPNPNPNIFNNPNPKANPNRQPFSYNYFLA